MAYRNVAAFTTKALTAAKPGDTITERVTRGLRFVVGLGVRSWFYRYDWQGAQRQVTFGSWPTMGIAEARARFAELRAARKAGNGTRSRSWPISRPSAARMRLQQHEN